MIRRAWTSIKRRREALELRYPRLLAWRHVSRGTIQALVFVLGITLINLEPLFSWLPDVDLPDVELPAVELPPWADAILGAAGVWFPILVGIVITARELRRRREAD